MKPLARHYSCVAYSDSPPHRGLAQIQRVCDLLRQCVAALKFIPLHFFAVSVQMDEHPNTLNEHIKVDLNLDA